MQTIKEIEKRMQYIQLKIDGEILNSQREHDRADIYRRDGDAPKADAHDNTAAGFDQAVLLLQAQLVNLTNEAGQLQSRITELENQKQATMAEKDAEIQRIDDEIVRIQGRL